MPKLAALCPAHNARHHQISTPSPMHILLKKPTAAAVALRPVNPAGLADVVPWLQVVQVPDPPPPAPACRDPFDLPFCI